MDTFALKEKSSGIREYDVILGTGSRTIYLLNGCGARQRWRRAMLRSTSSVP